MRDCRATLAMTRVETGNKEAFAMTREDILADATQCQTNVFTQLRAPTPREKEGSTASLITTAANTATAKAEVNVILSLEYLPGILYHYGVELVISHTSSLKRRYNIFE